MLQFVACVFMGCALMHKDRVLLYRNCVLKCSIRVLLQRDSVLLHSNKCTNPRSNAQASRGKGTKLFKKL